MWLLGRRNGIVYLVRLKVNPTQLCKVKGNSFISNRHLNALISPYYFR